MIEKHFPTSFSVSLFQLLQESNIAHHREITTATADPPRLSTTTFSAAISLLDCHYDVAETLLVPAGSIYRFQQSSIANQPDKPTYLISYSYSDL